jgi:hypothetical protein
MASTSFCDSVRQAAAETRSLEERARVAFDDALTHEELEEPADRRQLPQARSNAEAPACVCREELRHVALGHVLGARAVPQRRRELVQVTRIGLERVARHATLDAKVVEVGVDAAGEVHSPPL